MAARHRLAYRLSTPILLLVSALLAAPFIAFLLNAFARSWFYPQLIPQQWSLDAWMRVFSSQSDFLQALGNSLLIAGLVTPLVAGDRPPQGGRWGYARFAANAWSSLCCCCRRLCRRWPSAWAYRSTFCAGGWRGAGSG
ncbi:MAG: hypothetical protein IPK19_39155 [Chloroflexi bacterium]|nr:hypothetical protein [Chloroflexota bacterium]